MTVTKAKPSTNKSLAKAVRVLKLFSAQEPRLPLAEISARLDMPKSTTHAILPDVARLQVAQRLRDADDARRRRLARRTTSRRSWPVPTRWR